ncbi:MULTISPECIES: Hsp20/alpha crystallin family protein [Spirulina sp. CCY15215]|uniref:Hsp20/alpha crystallin family protein n=1 Tax=Spirulina sp. CCY15215 TaxID=2767591 RepID=UPI00194F467E|nr:Hsp20/alpha crystallin family protein [Spirulina major]
MLRTQRYSYPDLASLRRQMNQLYRDESANHGRNDRETPWSPPVELENFSDRLVLRVLLPGISSQDIDISVQSKMVTIQGKRPYQQKADSRGFFQAEFPYGEFERKIPLPLAVSHDGIEASFAEGILTLNLYKREARENRAVKVNLSKTQTSDRIVSQSEAIADPWND